MKYILCIETFLVLSLSAHSIPVKRDGQNAMLDYFNTRRAKIAVEENIGNMNELVWDSNFAKQAAELKCKDFKNNRVNQMAVAIFDDETTDRLTKLEPKEREAEYRSVRFQALGYPGQTHVGCAYLKTPCSSTTGVHTTIEGICLIGPSTTRGKILKGNPGTKCPGGSTKNGLCKTGGSLSGIAKKPVLLDTENWADRMNQHRAKYAKHYNIARMYELTWDPSLAEKASKLECAKFYKPGPDYRAMAILDDSTSNAIVSLPDEEREEQLDGIGYNSMRIPGQTRIGCADLEIPCSRESGLVKRINGACLFGPETEFGDVEIGEFGSKCPNGKGRYGLCKALPKGVTPKYDDGDEGESEDEKEGNSSGTISSFVIFLYFFVLRSFLEYPETRKKVFNSRYHKTISIFGFHYS